MSIKNTILDILYLYYEKYDIQAKSKYAELLYIFIQKYSLITFLPELYIKQNKLNKSNDLNKSYSFTKVKFSKFLNYYKNNKKIIDINIINKNNLIEYNFTNINFKNDKNNIKLLNPFELGIVRFNWLNELITHNKLSLNLKKKINIANLNIYFSDIPENIIDNNTYIENISLIKAISNKRKQNAILNYVNDEYDYYYINNPYLSNNIKYINWYKSSLSYNINRLFISSSKKDLLNIKTKYNLIHCNLRFKKKIEINKKTNKRYLNYLVRENKLLPSLLFVVLFSLLHLNKNGGLIIKLFETYNKETQDLLVILYLTFDNVKFYRPKIMNNNFIEKYIICHNFKGCDKNILNKLLKIKDKLDKELVNNGFNVNIKNKDRKHDIYKFYLPPFDKKTHSSYNIKQIINYDDIISSKEKKQIENFLKLNDNLNIKLIKKQINFRKKINLLIEKTFNYNERKLNTFIQNYLKKRLPKCINYCKKYNIPINNEFLPENERTLLKISKAFPTRKNVDKSKIQYMDQSIYYISEYHDAMFVNKIIKNVYSHKNISDISVLDATSHIGGNTIPIALYGFKTTAVEIDKNIIKLLKYNLKLYNLDVNVICEDFIKYIKKIKYQNAIFLDPPWGGSGYKSFDKLYLYISNLKLVQVVNKLKNKTDLIILKVPFNYDIHEFIKKNNYSRIIQLFKMEKYYLISVISEKLNLFKMNNNKNNNLTNNQNNFNNNLNNNLDNNFNFNLNYMNN